MKRSYKDLKILQKSNILRSIKYNLKKNKGLIRITLIFKFGESLWRINIWKLCKNLNYIKKLINDRKLN